jgi:hypothetical protein
MKTFNKTSLPKFVNYNKRQYVCNFDLSSKKILQSITSDLDILKQSGKKVIFVNVLSRNLKDKTDLHGRQYKPSQWIFVSI